MEKNTKKFAKQGLSILLCIMLVMMQCQNSRIFVKAADTKNEYTAVAIETGKLTKQGTKTDIKGKIVETDTLSHMHKGIVGVLEEETEIHANGLRYNETELNQNHSIYSKKAIQVNTSKVDLSNILYAKDDIHINSTNITAPDYTILYSQEGSIYISM